VDVKFKISGLYPQQKQWLLENVGGQEYLLNSGVGGTGWNFRWEPRVGYQLYIADDRLATAFLLKFGQ
jgi:hypothetical protein